MANTWMFTANCLETQTVLPAFLLVFIYFSLPENINPYFPITFFYFFKCWSQSLNLENT